MSIPSQRRLVISESINPYRLGFINIPTKKASSYCCNSYCNSPTYSMCKFPRIPSFTSWCINCPESQRAVIKGLTPI